MKRLDRPVVYVIAVLLLVTSILIFATSLRSYNKVGTHSLPTAPIVIRSTPTTPVSRQDTELVAVMQSLKLDYSKLNLIYGDNPMISGEDASFQLPNTMYLSPTINPIHINRAISHEYIHYMQQIDPATAAYYPYLDNLYSTNSWLYNRMSLYRLPTYCPSKICLSIAKEAGAYACTEMPDSDLSPSYVAWCNSKLPMRYSLY